MNFKEPLPEWVRQLAWDSVAVGEDVMFEARENLHRFTCTADQAKILETDEICEFFDYYIDVKKNQLNNEYDSYNMVIYIWFDEMVGSLCSSLISRTHLPQLPFSCCVNTDVRLEDIVDRFLRSRYLEGIPYDELTFERLPGDIISKAPPSSEPLPVFLVSVP